MEVSKIRHGFTSIDSAIQDAQRKIEIDSRLPISIKKKSALYMRNMLWYHLELKGGIGCEEDQRSGVSELIMRLHSAISNGRQTTIPMEVTLEEVDYMWMFSLQKEDKYTIQEMNSILGIAIEIKKSFNAVRRIHKNN